MSLIDQIHEDVRRITTNLNEFGREAVIYDAEGANPVGITVIQSHHHLSVDTDGNPINEMNAHASISFSEMDDKGIDYRNSEGEISLRGRILYVNNKWFEIRNTWPSETTALAVCVLGNLPNDKIPS